MKSYGTRTSSETIVPYTKPRKPIMSKKERELQKKSYKSYNINGGGNDIA